MNHFRLAGRARFVLCLAALAPLLTACAKQSRVVTGSVSSTQSAYAARSVSMDICSGYGCEIKDKFKLSYRQNEKLRLIMKPGKKSPAAERKAIRRAVAEMEKMALKTLKFQADIQFSYQVNAGKRGQMDCVDESLNTIRYLQHLYQNGLMIHHTPDALFASRGFIFDGRYPHKSATMRDKSGTSWAVDSWKSDNGSRPEITLLSRWQVERNAPNQY